MEFVVVGADDPGDRRPRTGYLHPNDWDDWFRFETTFSLVYVDDGLLEHPIGSVKIGRFGMGKGAGRNAARDDGSGFRNPELPNRFHSLARDRFFSLGQDADYYDALNRLGADVRETILGALNDLAYDDALLAPALGERVTEKSLLRFISRATVEGQFRRMAHGGARLTRYRFTFFPGAPDAREDGIGFLVVPDSKPPTNIQVLIGRNGVGKTRLLDRMTRALVGQRSHGDGLGEFEFVSADAGDTTGFSKVVSVSFSAFDSVDPVTPRRGENYVYIGLKASPERAEPTGPTSRVSTKSPLMLSREFSSSVLNCLRGERLPRWRRALSHLQADPVFADYEVASLADDEDSEDEDKQRARARDMFRSLSSGHKIVLLIMTRLVEQVDERSLVLIDEPEAHLHPPLLSAFVRALSDLLVDRNGVALVATHSPVVLQEVPHECAWILHKSGGATSFVRPRVETFGENVSVLTQDVFGLEVTKSGFHQLLLDAVAEGGSYDDILANFRGHLGGEARSILRGLVATRDRDLA
ncbi:AAA family ATPase [Nocardia sp. IFM 10818]